MLRSAILGAAFLGLAAPAFANSFTFETAKPVDEPRVTVIGTVWSCEGTVCTGEMDRKKVTLRDCKKIAKKAGEITSFKNDKFELSAEDIETCKGSARD
ncbi:CC_3452 family protein [uncultured Hyphomonas sp.]|uniref:CC_3452 family protein n=1 Tax=uncultured Hyphomonas sp. TaxID=225298 RepID=UPI002AAC21E2|nr:hypothetical protein [uncultured Hyphomonas sp.]